MCYKKKMGNSSRIFFLLLFAMFFLSSVSAEIIFKQQPNEVYNVGDSVSVPVVVKTLSDFSGVFEMNLICSGQEINFYKNGVGLSAGEEREMETTLVLVPEIVGVVVGNCKIKAVFGEESILSDEFRVSDLIICDSKINQDSVKPDGSILIEGSAAKETGSSANGFLDLNVISSDSVIVLTKHGTINNGFFSVNLSVPKNMKAGKYIGEVKAYEKRLEKITNKGDSSFEFFVEQMPSNLEIISEDGVNPGEELSIRVVLHDQTGENIFETITVSVRDSFGKLVEEMEVSTDKEIGILIPSGELPGNWKVVTDFGLLTGEKDFEIFENEEIFVELVNETVLIKNIGNVVYDEDVLVKVGNESLSLNVTLGIGEVQKYVLTAPNGNYDIQVRGGGESKYEGMVLLTGNVIGIEEMSSGILGFVLHPVVWIFIIVVLGIFIFIFFKKGYKKTFIGRVYSDKGEKKDKKKMGEVKEKSLFGAKHKAELSLSIKGERQDVCLVYLKIKNLKSFLTKGNFCEETFSKIVNCADKNKAFVSEGQDGLSFILLPSVTKTFRNESVAISIANEINLILEKHNKMFKQEIDYGISVNYGSLIGKVKGGILYYMSLGSLVTLAKKISNFSEKRVLLSEDLRSRLSSNIKVIKEVSDDLVFYSIKEIKEKENHEKFLQSFLKRVDGGK